MCDKGSHSYWGVACGPAINFDECQWVGSTQGHLECVTQAAGLFKEYSCRSDTVCKLSCIKPSHTKLLLIGQCFATWPLEGPVWSWLTYTKCSTKIKFFITLQFTFSLYCICLFRNANKSTMWWFCETQWLYGAKVFFKKKISESLCCCHCVRSPLKKTYVILMRLTWLNKGWIKSK